MACPGEGESLLELESDVAVVEVAVVVATGGGESVLTESGEGFETGTSAVSVSAMTSSKVGRLSRRARLKA